MRESVRPVPWSVWPSTPAAASHLAAIPLQPGNSLPRRSWMRATLRMPAGHSLSASVATCELFGVAVAGVARPTSASSVYPHPAPALWHRSHRAGPGPRPLPTTFPAAATAPHACFATPKIAAVPALPHPDKAPFPVPSAGPPALGTPYQLQLTAVTHPYRKHTFDWTDEH